MENSILNDENRGRKTMKVKQKELLKEDKLSESLMIGMTLALVGGYLDIYSYLARGKVFANTQTGNLVLLGYNIAQGNMSKVLYYLLAIFAFVLGVWLAKVIEYKFKARKYFDWLQLIVILVMVALFLVMFMPEGRWNIIANITVSFVCGLQVQGFRKVRGKSYSTVMFTGNLKNLAEQTSQYFIMKDREALKASITYFSIIATFVVGGWLGTLMVDAYQERAVGIVSIILILVFILLYLEKKNQF